MKEAALRQATVEDAIELGLTAEEFEMVKDILGRVPNFTETSIYSVMWSEHCSYKNSILWLKKLPKEGPNMLVQAGEENAGMVDIGDGLGCVFKIESHNHPSAVEPYHGAATGVGGINRDIFTMGARPIAGLNSLRLGNLKEDRTKWLLKEAVKGMADYGNTLGVPNIGGELIFDESFHSNPLVNAFSAGIIDPKKMISATASGVGNPVYIVGRHTGREGIAGAAFASKVITEETIDGMSEIQKGDPEVEKRLLEATLELAETNAIVGMQDMGAAGITCSTCEMSAEGKVGMDIWLDKTPVKHEKMQPFEILLSETQERMLIVVNKGEEKVAEEIFKKWDLPIDQIGVVTEGTNIRYFYNKDLVAEVPAESLVLGGGAPVYEREYKEPTYYQEYKKFDIENVEQPEDLKEVANFLLEHPNIVSKHWIQNQFDSNPNGKTISDHIPTDAGIVEIEGTRKLLAMTVDCNSRYVHADPQQGTAMAVAEAARNIVCSGGIPSAISNCLNFGNPYNPESYWQFVEAIKGMSEACLKFKTPVTGGNVSFYNQTVKDGNETPVFPTPTIAMIGIIENKERVMSLNFKQKGDLIFMLGETAECIASSEYLTSFHKVVESPAPYFNIDKEYKIQETVKTLITKNFITAAHDVSNGGLFITLVEMSLPNELGFDIVTDSFIREDAFLFGEAGGRVVVSVSEDFEDDFIEYMMTSGVEYMLLGHVTQGKIVIDDEHYGFIQAAKEKYNKTLENLI
ncbi:MAG: phosphoribosylformylglycinamidine synthase subunit PurL [Brumimicrobium sp.]